MKYGVVTLIIVLITASCNEKTESLEKDSKKENVQLEKEEVEENDLSSSTEVNDSKIASINEYRLQLEKEVDKPIEIRSDQLREKTKQKWSKIHFYEKDGEVVRIKSYPYEGISERTEEFYLKDGQLVLAVIEDHGHYERGKEKEEIDKIYYFDNEEVIKEIASDKELEFAVKNSDGEELLSEVNEYFNVYKEKVKSMSK